LVIPKIAFLGALGVSVVSAVLSPRPLRPPR
jgi:hypothetical protein